MSLTPPQRHALRVVCEMSRRGDPISHVRRDSTAPVRSLAARGLVAWTPRGLLEPTEAGWEIAARMRPPILRDRLEQAAAALAAEARQHGAASISALHEEIDANEAIADALETAGFDPLDHEAANAITAQADALLAGGAP